MSDTTLDTPAPQGVKIDRSVTTVLVVIAILLGIMGSNYIAKHAKSDDNRECGTSSNPCYVKILP